MQRKSISRIIILGAVTLIGMLVVQAIWLKSSLDSRKSQFTQNVQSALRASASAIVIANGGDANVMKAVEQLSSNYFVVPINDVIQPQLLESILVNEFKLRNIEDSFEYSIYDCSNEKIVFGSYITQDEAISSVTEFPEIAKEDYYFSVLFPNISFHLINRMSIWLSSSVILVLIVIIYTYTLMMLFRQKKMADFQRDFINNMTHEFKTPLASISASSEIIISESMEPHRLKQYAGIIHKEAERLSKQVEKFLNLSKMEDELPSLKLAPLNLVALMEETRIHFENDIKVLNASFSFHSSVDNPVITNDKVYVSNCLFNLVDNALKYGGKPARVELRLQEVDKGSMLLEVIDNGNGIDSAVQQYLFDRFYRVPTGDVHTVKGFGLGLYYVKLMSKILGGDIFLKKSNKQGSIFVLKLIDHAK